MNSNSLLYVWIKGWIIPGWDNRLWRRDAFGWIMYFHEYGNRRSVYGWEVDHIRPVSQDGGNNIFNLRPVHWLNNASGRQGYASNALRRKAQVGIQKQIQK